MEYQPYLIIELNQNRYGINAYAVQEVFFLPNITVIPESPVDVVGVINLRGEILPILSIHRRFGLVAQPYRLSDSVVVVAGEDGQQVGLIVNRTYEVQAIDTQTITLAPNHNTAASQRFVAGLAKLETELITLINPDRLIHYGTVLTDMAAGGAIADLALDPGTATGRDPSPGGSPSDPGDRRQGDSPLESDSSASALGDRPDPAGLRPQQGFFAHATPEEREVLEKRTHNLRKRTQEESFSGLVSYAVVGLQGEYFGMGLEAIHEFTDVNDVTPIPCCPPHIVGNLNLRGEILTLVDISGILNLPLLRSEKGHKAIVARLDQLVAGITVDEVFDVVYLHPADISPIPAAVHALNDEYIRGIAPYQDKQMSILDLPKLLNSSELVVDETV